MTGQVIQRGNKLLIKDGEDSIPLTNNCSYIARIGSIFEFTYVWIGNIKYAEIKL